MEVTPATSAEDEYHPRFLDALNEHYTVRRKNIHLLTGNVQGLFWNAHTEDFIPLEESLYRELRENFLVVRVDIAGGLTFYDDEDTKQELVRIWNRVPKGKPIGREACRRFEKVCGESISHSLATFVLLKDIVTARREMAEDRVKPICMIFAYTGSLFPDGAFSRLSELDRQRLVFFLNWVTNPEFVKWFDLIILVNEVKSEVNAKITELPHTAHIEIQLPDVHDRKMFVTAFRARFSQQEEKRVPAQSGDKEKQIRFEGGAEQFCTDTAGLSIPALKSMLETASRTGQMITKTNVVDAVNEIVQAQLGDIIRVKYPRHTPDDIIGYQSTQEILAEVFQRCEDPETAVSAMIASGPNGVGKTFQLEAHAARSGRVVIELAGIRGQYFGQTDTFFEKLRWHIDTLGKILILVDEAHTAFGSVHGTETHATERRLAGNIIKLMGDPHYHGKVLWALITSRPDQLDPDVKSRAPVQIPIFDLEDDDRERFLAEMFRRAGIAKSDEPEWQAILRLTQRYSSRDYDYYVKEISTQKRKDETRSPLDVLHRWQASRAIESHRELQMLVAVLHCCYPQLIPSHLRELDEGDIMRRVEELKMFLRT